MIFELLVAGAFALATLRRFSVAQIIILTIFAFFLSSGPNSASGEEEAYKNIEVITMNPVFQPRLAPWLNPCGTALPTVKKFIPHRKPNVRKAREKMELQLNIAARYLKQDLFEADEIYSKVYKESMQYEMNWLPRRQLEWYKREICHLSRPRIKYILPHFYTELQIFSITFHYLKKFRLESNIETTIIMQMRNKLMENMLYRIRALQCVVETMLQTELIESLPHPKTKDIITRNPQWTYRGDFTQMLIQDWGVLSYYETFLHEATQVIQNCTAVYSKSDEACPKAKAKHVNKMKKNRNDRKKLSAKHRRKPNAATRTRLNAKNKAMRKRRPRKNGRNGTVPRRSRKNFLKRQFMQNELSTVSTA